MGQYADAVSQILLEQGRQQAQAELARGQAWGQAAQQLGQIPTQITQMQDAQQHRELQRQQIASAKAAEADRVAQTAVRDRAAKDQQTLNLLYGQAFEKDPDSGILTFKRGLVEQGLAQSGNAHLLPQTMKDLDAMDTSAKAMAASRRGMVAQALMNISTHGNTSEAALSNFAYLKQNGALADDRLQPMLDQIAADPSPAAIKALVERVGGAIPEYGDLVNKETKRKSDLAHVDAETAHLTAPVNVPEGGTLVDPVSGAVKFTAPVKPTAVTEAQLDAAAQALLSKQAQGQALTPQESADLKAYQLRKRTVSDPAALEASSRQTAAINATNARLDKSELFTRQETGRKELSAKVEQPYLDAREKADTLRNVIAASENGNMAAGAVTPLLATLGFVTMEGVKRINTTELQQVEGAGSLFERIKGQASKLVTGQPMSQKLRDDLKQMATLLEQSARKKYEDAHTATTKRYGLTDETPLPDPHATPAKPLTAAELIKKYGGG